MTDPVGRVSFYDYNDSLRQASVIAPSPATTPYDTIKDDDDSSEGGTTTYQATVGYSWTNNNSASGAYGGARRLGGHQ